jgi:hypothetical protein
MFWTPVASSETSPFMLVSVRYADNDGHTTGYGYAIAKSFGYTNRGIDFENVTRETAVRRDAERTLAAYERDYAAYNDEALAERYGAVAEGGWMSGQITSRESRRLATHIITQEARDEVYRNIGSRSTSHRTIDPDLNETYAYRVSSSKTVNLCGSSFVDDNRDSPILRTIDIVPDGDSTVSDPKFLVWYDGRLESHTYDSFEQAVGGAFYPYAWPGGNEVAYYTPDGDTLCNQCAGEEWVESGVAFTPEIANTEYGYGVECDNNPKHMIHDPRCVDCRNSLEDIWASGTNVFIASDEADEPHYLCADCLMNAMEDGEVDHVENDQWPDSRQFITIEDDEWFMKKGVVYTDMAVDLSVYANA